MGAVRAAVGLLTGDRAGGPIPGLPPRADSAPYRAGLLVTERRTRSAMRLARYAVSYWNAYLMASGISRMASATVRPFTARLSATLSFTRSRSFGRCSKPIRCVRAGLARACRQLLSGHETTQK